MNFTNSTPLEKDRRSECRAQLTPNQMALDMEHFRKRWSIDSSSSLQSGHKLSLKPSLRAILSLVGKIPLPILHIRILYLS